MAPRIGISMSPDLIDGRAVFALNRVYADAVRAAGGIPLLLPALDPEDLDSVLGCLDGLLLSGGGDVDPARYGAEAQPEVACVDADRDRWELALARAAVARDVPLLGICRGVQVLNIALGGTLVQHVPARTGQVHRVADRFAEAVHDVALQPGSAVAAVLGGSATIGVNSLHHQAVERLGEGLCAVGWAEDGTVEAVEGTGGRRVLGVQWHPELLIAERAHAALFAWLVEEAVRSTTVLPIHGHAAPAHPAQVHPAQAHPARAHTVSANATATDELADAGAVAANFSDASADTGALAANFSDVAADAAVLPTEIGSDGDGGEAAERAVA